MPVNPDLEWAIADVRRRAPLIAKRRRFYEGIHPVLVEVNNPTLSPLMKDLLEELSDNLCDDVVDESVGRLAVAGFTVKSGEVTDDDGDEVDATAQAIAQAIQDAWDENRGPSRLTRLARDAWMAGDAFAIVQTDPKGRGRFYPQHPEQMAVRYSEDEPDTIQVAAKVWQSGKRWRANLYYGPESEGGARLERFTTKGTSPHGVPDAKNFQPVEGTDEQGNLLANQPETWERCPVYHFPADEVGQYGRSVLSDVIPLQNLLNKSVADLVVAMEEVALPGRWATGIQATYDDNGNEKPLFRRSKSALEFIRTASETAEFGQFPAADLSQFLEVQQAWRGEIARKGYLPPHSVGLGGETPTGISLLVTEGRQIKRVKNAQRDWTPELLAMLTHVAALSTGGVPIDPAALEVEWERPETRDDQALWELLLLKRSLGVPDEQLLVEGGYSPDEAQKWADTAAERRDAMAGGRMSLPGAGIGSLGLGDNGPGLGLPSAPSSPAGAPDPALA